MLNPPRKPDIYTQQMVQYVRSYINWGARYGAKVLLNELGWPNNLGATDIAQWNRANLEVLRYCNQRGAGVIAWDSGEMRFNYPFAPWQPPITNFNPVSVVKGNAAPWEAYLPTASSPLSGVYLNTASQNAVWGNENNTQASGGSYQRYFSNVNRGSKGAQYAWDGVGTTGGLNTFQFLYSRGVRCVAIGFRWERLQPTLGGAFDSVYFADLISTVNLAIAAGLRVIIQPFNKGAYYIDTSQLGIAASPSYGVKYRINNPSDHNGDGVTPRVTNAHFNNLWSRLATQFNATPGVVAFGIMNEPATGSMAYWQSTTQNAVDTLRAAGFNRTIIVNVLTYQSASGIAAAHPTPWISDPLNDVVYGVSVYWDGGNYINTYNTISTKAREGWGFYDNGAGADGPVVYGLRMPQYGEFPWLTSATMHVFTGQFAPDPTTGDGAMNIRSFLPNGTLQAYFAAWETSATGREQWLQFRMSWNATFDFWRFGIAGNTWYLQKWVNGSPTNIGSTITTTTGGPSGTGIPLATNQLVEVDISGPYIKCYVGGVLVYETTDSFLQGSAMMGLSFTNAPNARVDWVGHKLNLNPRGLNP